MTPGVTGGSIEFDESEARDIYMTSPYWRSGNPGRPAKVSLHNWPAGYTVSPTDYSYSPKPTPKTWGAFTTTGSTMTRNLTIPSTAPPGYTYNLVFSRVDSGSMMQLEVPFQVAKPKASRTSIRKGNGIRLSGRIPTVGHWGSTPGKKKYVLLYKRTTTGYPPRTWDARKKGWTKVRFYQANGYGYFRTGYFRPKRTTRYIVRYFGDSQYYRGYTSMIKVTVR